jgi:hypothetical protein
MNYFRQEKSLRDHAAFMNHSPGAVTSLDPKMVQAGVAVGQQHQLCPVGPRQMRMSVRPLALGDSELMAQYQDLRVPPPKIIPSSDRPGPAHPAAGTSAVLWHCNGNPDQQWRWGTTASYNGIVYQQLENGHNQWLGTDGGLTNIGTELVSWTCLGSDHPDQYWAAPYYTDCGLGHIIYDYATVAAGQLNVIGTLGGGTSTDGTPIILWDFQNSCNNQIWYPAPQPSSAFLRSRR